VFESNPAAGCLPQSIVGHAKVITPLLPVPREGTAYFVSHAEYRRNVRDLGDDYLGTFPRRIATGNDDD
jgi:hypothetical protein